MAARWLKVAGTLVTCIPPVAFTGFLGFLFLGLRAMSSEPIPIGDILMPMLPMLVPLLGVTLLAWKHPTTGGVILVAGGLLLLLGTAPFAISQPNSLYLVFVVANLGPTAGGLLFLLAAREGRRIERAIGDRATHTGTQHPTT
jgi:hypothetical protein